MPFNQECKLLFSSYQCCSSAITLLPTATIALLRRMRTITYCNMLRSHWSEAAPSTGKPMREKWGGVITLIICIDQQREMDGFPLWYHLSFQVQLPVELPHWESLPPIWPEVWHKRNVGCHANGRGGGDIQAYNRLPMPRPFVKAWLCSILYCDEKVLNGPSRKHNSAFSCHCVFPVGPMPQTLVSTSLSLTKELAITYETVALSKGLRLFKFTKEIWEGKIHVPC